MDSWESHIPFAQYSPLSIEDAKQKAEHDRKIKLAEEKKQTVRRQIASLRRAFAKLRQRDNDLPEQLHLDSREFVMDPDMEEQLKHQSEEKVGQYHVACRVTGTSHLRLVV